MKLDLTILISCLNEEENVQNTMRSVISALEGRQEKYEILVMDDGSTDRTYQRACEFRDAHPERSIRVHKNAKNLGLGGAFNEGARLGLGKYYRLCCGDNSEPIETLKTIFSHLGEADIVAPYHVIHGRSAGRKVISSTYTTLVNALSGHRLKYYNGCPILLRESVLKWPSRTNGFGFQADILTQMLDAGATYVEFPVFSTERKEGKSKALTFGNLESTGSVLWRILAKRVFRNKRR